MGILQRTYENAQGNYWHGTPVLHTSYHCIPIRHPTASVIRLYLLPGQQIPLERHHISSTPPFPHTRLPTP